LMTDGERLSNIDKALQTDVVQNQFSSWNEQKELLRVTLKELWPDTADSGGRNHFKNWWTTVNEDIRTAMVFTALEDLSSNAKAESFASLFTVVCPELLNLDSLLADRGIKVVDLLEVLVNERENDEQVFSFPGFMETINNSGALTYMQLARSCLLLQFATGIMLVVANEAAAAPTLAPTSTPQQREE